MGYGAALPLEVCANQVCGSVCAKVRTMAKSGLAGWDSQTNIVWNNQGSAKRLHRATRPVVESLEARQLLSVATVVVQAEAFDTGGEGTAYHDTTSANQGGAYRTTEGVDIQATSDSGGGYNVGWTAAGEWMQYTVSIPATGTYNLSFRVASSGAGGTFHVNVDGVNMSGAMTVPNTGGWQAWKTITSSTISMTAGKHVMRVAMDTTGGSYVGNMNWFKIVNVSTTTTTVPAAPSGLAASASSASAISLTWTDNSTDESGYYVERSTDGTSFSQIASLGAGANSYSSTGLAAATKYYYRVRAYNSAGPSAYTAVASATTQAATVTVPAAPSGLAASSSTTSTVDLSWTDNSSNEAGYYVDRSTDGTNFTQIASVGAGVTSYCNTGLATATKYYYRVCAYNSAGESADTPVASATTQAATVVVPAAPSGLAASASSSSAIGLSWTDNATNETGYYVQRSIDGTNFSQIASLGAGATSYSDTGLAAATKYYYRVSAYNSAGASAFSVVASATTQAATVVVPAAPSGLAAAASSSSTIGLTWTDNATNETGYYVERSTDGTNFSQIASLGAGATSYSSTGLTAATKYYYRVDAYNSAGASAYTSVANATTMAASAATGQITWTTFTPSVDTKTIYVSSSTGSDSNSGLDAAHPIATLAKGYSLMRNGYPDWMLLKAGDTWTNQNFNSWKVSGRSAAEPMLLSSYGTGARPTISESGNNGLNFYGATTGHIAISGIHLVGQGAGVGIFIYSPGTDYLIENSVIEGFNDNIVAEPDTSISNVGPSNVRIRGSQILDAYNASGQKSQGLFACAVDGMVLEYNVLDHNGWKTGAQTPDIYSHNAYLDDMTHLTIRSNVFSNASSFGLLVRSENAPSATQHVLIENNLFVGDGNGMSIGARTGDGAWVTYGAVDVTVRNNVMTEIGRVIGGADQSYGIDLGSINGGLITGNVLYNKSDGGTSFGIRLVADTASQNVTISNNVIYNWNQGCIEMGTGPLTNIVVTGNVLRDNLYGSALEVTDGAVNPQVKYSNNTYFSNAAASNWFSVNDASLSSTSWIAASHETGASQVQFAFPDASRTVESYSALIGGSNTLSSLISSERSQSQTTWRPELAAVSIVTYLDQGFGITPIFA